MKNFKRLMAVVMTVVMLCALSTVAFAASTIDESATYTFEVKTDKTEYAPGDDMYVSVYVYGPESSFQIESDTSSALIYGFKVPSDLVDMTGMLNGRGNALASGNITKNYDLLAAKGSYQDAGSVKAITENISVNDEESYAPAVITKDTAVATYKFKVSSAITATTSFNITVMADNIAAVDSYTGVQMKSVQAKDATVTVKVATPEPPAEPTVDTDAAEGYTTVIGTNGTIYNNVWVGEYSATPETGAALTSMTVSFKDGAKVFDVADYKTVEGEATLEFSIALIGVPTSENLAGTVAATAAWAN